MSAHAPEQTPLDDLDWRQPLADWDAAYGSEQPPTPLPSARLLTHNPAAAELLGLDPALAHSDDFARVFAGNRVPASARPYAQAYAGHQFGVWAGRLGDGRAISLGQVCNADGQFWDVQLKGAGKTPYSRFADGRAVLRSTVREYLASAAMAGLGIPTTRALCIITSDEPVQRETVETAAVLTRLAPSHLRFGSFEHLFYSRRFDLLAPLADALIADHEPDLLEVEAGAPRYRAWVARVIERTAELVAQWQSVGFCHGVMNTDNMSVLGLTLDYGPFGFMDAFEPGWICNHSDTAGRYAYDQQPGVALWNLSRFVQAVLPLLDDDPDTAVEVGQSLLEAYREAFDQAYMRRMRAKLGLGEARDGDADLLDALLRLMARSGADFTRSFRALGEAADADAPFVDEFADRDAAAQWLADWRRRLAGEGDASALALKKRMHAVNPRYVLRNYLAQNAIEAAEAGDAGEIERLHALLSRPFDDQPDSADYARLPPASAALISVSCSS